MSDEFRKVSWNDAVRLSQESLKAVKIKRFYGAVAVAEVDGGFAVTLDGRVAKTPGKARLVAPARALAEAIAAEFAGQGEFIEPGAMPFARLANTALDGVAAKLDATRADMAGYAATDLVCYRATEPEKLVARQAAAFDPVLAWAEETLGARFVLGGGLMPVAQPAASVKAAREAVFAYEDPYAVAALHAMTALSGSVILALAVARRAISAEAAWRAAHVDEDFQIEAWGEDEEAKARRALRWRDFEVAAKTIAAVDEAGRP